MHIYVHVYLHACTCTRRFRTSVISRRNVHAIARVPVNMYTCIHTSNSLSGQSTSAGDVHVCTLYTEYTTCGTCTPICHIYVLVHVTCTVCSTCTHYMYMYMSCMYIVHVQLAGNMYNVHVHTCVHVQCHSVVYHK